MDDNISAELETKMGLKNEFRKMIEQLAAQFSFPPVFSLFFPPLCQGGQKKDAQFMALMLDSGACGISYVLLPDEKFKTDDFLRPGDYIGKDPIPLALEFGTQNPEKEMIALAAINAICQHAMKTRQFQAESSTDTLSLLSISQGDRIGMVGLFYGLVKKIRAAGAELVIIEKNKHLINKYPDLPLTMDPARLNTCNKILCTSTVILNNSLDEILDCCRPDAFVSVVGPTAGYFPDPLFARGVDVVGGRVVKEGDKFMDLISHGQKWGQATVRTCFQKQSYAGIGMI